MTYAEVAAEIQARSSLLENVLFSNSRTFEQYNVLIIVSLFVFPSYHSKHC